MRNWIPIGFSILLLAGCGSRQQQQIPATVTDNMPHYDAFVSTHSFPYVAPIERQTRLTQNYSRLSTGLGKSEVARILGQPDCSESMHSKTVKPGYIGSAWTYFFEKPDPHLTNLKNDKAIEIFSTSTVKQVGLLQMSEVWMK